MTRRIGRESILALTAGVLAALSLPGFGISGLAYVALVPLLFAIDRGRSRSSGTVCGYQFGLAFFAIDIRWVLALARFNPLVIAGYLVLVAYLALPFAFVGWLLGRQRTPRASWMWLLVAPALFVLAEFVRTLGPLGTGFSMLHQALYRVAWLIQSASVLGSWAITAFIVAANVAVYLAIRRRRLRYAFLAVALIGLQAAFALLPTGSEATAPELAIALISSDVDQAVKLDARNLVTLTDRYLALADEALTQAPDLIVFPESFLPAYVLNRDDLYPRLADRAVNGNTELLFGTGEYADQQIFNSTVLVDRQGDVAGVYRMVRPVPFGEYVPGRALLERIGLGAWTRGLLPLDLSRGSDYQPLGEYGTPICFESVFPAAARAFTQNGASLLVTVTNDAWFNGSSELRAHFSTAVFRAVETRRWTVQVANGGVSGVVDSSGRIRSTILGEGVIVERSVKLLSAVSLYTRWGDYPLLIAMALIACVSVGVKLLPKRKKRGE